MKNTLKIDFVNGRIVMDRTFARKCANTRSDEYAQLQRVRMDYPKYEVSIRQIRKNTQKETYAGLTYGYMEKYIRLHEEGEQLEEVMAEYEELRLVAECHSKGHRYPTIKKWFLTKYPEVSVFGVDMDFLNDRKGQGEAQTSPEKPAVGLQEKIEAIPAA